MLLSDLIMGIELTGDIQKDSVKLLLAKGCSEVAVHTEKVACEARRIAGIYGINQEDAFAAGLLHDIGNIVPLTERVELCSALGIEIFEEERLNPSMLHPKLSKVIAKDIFGVKNEIFNAIECHSSLKANASELDMVLLIADKLSWDRIYNGAFIDNMLHGLKISLECCAFEYLKHLCNGNAEILHPWTIKAYNYLRNICM